MRRALTAVILGLLVVAPVAIHPRTTTAQTRTMATLLPMPPPPYPPPTYADVDAFTLYGEAISGMGRYGIMNGYPDGTFRPFEPVLRAQMAKIVYLGNVARWNASLPGLAEDTSCPFTDMGPDDAGSLYPHQYVGKVAEQGILRGYSDGTFRPYLAVSRAQAVTIIVRAAPSSAGPMQQVPPGYRSALGGFDAAHAPAMDLAEYRGYLRGVSGYGPAWDPWAEMTRGEVAQVMWDMLPRPIQ